MIAWRRNPLQNSMHAIVTMIGLVSILRNTSLGVSAGPTSPLEASSVSKSS